MCTHVCIHVYSYSKCIFAFTYSSRQISTPVIFKCTHVDTYNILMQTDSDADKIECNVLMQTNKNVYVTYEFTHADKHLLSNRSLRIGNTRSIHIYMNTYTSYVLYTNE